MHPSGHGASPNCQDAMMMPATPFLYSEVLCSAATGTNFRPHDFVSVYYILEMQNGVALLVPTRGLAV